MTLSNWKHISHANNVIAMAAEHTYLYALTADYKLWEREAVESDIPWKLLGEGPAATAIAAENGYMFATTHDNRLIESVPPFGKWWRTIGHAYAVVAMTHSIYGRQSFAATRDNKLWMREFGDHLSWTHIGHANNVVALAAIGRKGLDGRLFAATKDGKMWMRDAAPTEMNWAHVDTFPNVTAMAAISLSTWNGNVRSHIGKLFVASADNQLWVVDVPPTLPWTAFPRGRFHTPDGDIIDYTIEHNAVAQDIVEFVLAQDAAITWKKILNLPDGLGSSWDISPAGAGGAASNTLWAHQVDNGQYLTFKKAKFLGIITNVFILGELNGLGPGSRITFRWVHD